MHIIIRISPFKPDNPPVFYPDNKWNMVRFCHESLLKAGARDYQKTYIIDSTDWDFTGHGKQINIRSHNKNTSLLTAYEAGMQIDDDILFVEDDYLWLPNTLPLFEKALETFKVLSPYDHPGHYLEDKFDHKYEMKMIGNHTFRTCPSNTHTFAIQKQVLRDNYDMMCKYGVRDHEMFTELNKVAQMWCPVPSFATHLATGCLSPNIEWYSLQT